MKAKNIFARVIAMFLLLALVAGCMVGCGQPGAEKSTSAEEKTDGDNDASTGEDIKEPDKITMWSYWECRDMVNDPGDTAFYKAIEEACNVEIEFIDSEGGAEQMSILIGTNTLPDLVWCSKEEIAGGIHQLYIDGGVLPFNSFMDEGLMPNLSNIYENCPKLAQQVRTEDGKYIHAVSIDVCEMTGEAPITSYTSGFMIRQDWLDELDLEVPKSIKEMEDVLIAFKDKKGSLGLAFSYGIKHRLMTAFGLNDADSLYLDNGIVKFGPYEDVYKDFLELNNRWVNLGIIDADTYTQEQDTFWSKMATGKYGLVYGHRGSAIEKVHTFENYDEMNWQPIEFVPLEEGDEYPFTLVTDEPVLYNDSRMLFIPANSKNPEAAARVIDFLYSEEGTELMTWGVEGESFEVVNGQNVYTKHITENADGLGKSAVLQFYCSEILTTVGVMNTHKNIVRSLDWEEQVTANKVWELNNPGAASPLPSVTLTDAEREEASAIRTDLDTYVNESRLNFILGNLSLDKFEDYQQEMKKMKVERLLEIYQAAYDRTVGK